ncbi:MAG: hypothetical protein R3D33_10345 [Hyphomicrobiaceae bacterium]
MRFASIEGLERSDLPIASEIWQRDIMASAWTTREVNKLVVHFVRYMLEPNVAALALREIEAQCQLSRDEVQKALTLMRGYGAVTDFLIDGGELRVALNLTFLQRLDVLVTVQRFSDLQGLRGADPRPWTSARREAAWLPSRAIRPGTAA